MDASIKNKAENKQYLQSGINLLGIVILLLLIHLPPQFNMFVLTQDGFLVMHSLMEVFSATVSILLFFITYHTYKTVKSTQMMVLGCCFIAAGLFDIFHFLSYPGMADFFSANNANKSILFWLSARITVGLGILFYVVTASRQMSLPLKPVLTLLTAMTIFSIISFFIIVMPEYFPIMYVEGKGLSIHKIIVEWLIFLIYLSSAAVLYLRRHKVINCNVNSLLNALLLLSVSELFFTLYIDVHDVTNVLGHVYKVIGYYYLYKAIFSDAVSRPLKQIQAMLSYDELTGLASRSSFVDKLSRTIHDCKINNSKCSVIFIGLDNFKTINATLGHQVGDLLLLTVADRIKSQLPDTCYLSRLNGDIFAVLIENADENNAIKLIDMLVTSMKFPFKPVNAHLEISASMGLVVCPDDASCATEMMRHADTAMYHAKEKERTSYERFSAEMSSNILRRVDISNRLRDACDNLHEEFYLNFQPRVDLASGQISGMEALLRWKSPGLGVVSPAEFIPLAEANGSIVKIGRWVLEQACRQARQWHENYGVTVPVAVNLSARQLRDNEIINSVREVLAETQLSPAMLELEITESMLILDADHVVTLLSQIRQLGVSLAMDDFGTGYSSLSYLKKLPLDYLKIDRSFVTDVSHCNNDKSIVNAIINVAHSLGLRVIAEGIEDVEQLEFMLSQDCDEIQGYYFSKPLSVDGMDEFLRTGHMLQDAFSIA